MVQFNVESPADSHGKGVVAGIHVCDTRRCGQAPVKVSERPAKEKFGERFESVRGNSNLWPGHICKQVALKRTGVYQGCRSIRIENYQIAKVTRETAIALQVQVDSNVSIEVIGQSTAAPIQ